MSVRSFAGGAFSLLIVAAVSGACVGDDPGFGGGGDGGAHQPDGGSSVPESSTGPACDRSVCLDDARLSLCEDGVSRTVACGINCDAANARCRTFEPVGPATREDLVATGLIALRLEDHVLDVTNGQITTGDGTLVRPSNTNTLVEEVHAGVAFRRTAGAAPAAILRARSLEIVSLRTQGQTPLVLVAGEDIVVSGTWRVTCGTLGGRAGGLTGTAAVGDESGQSYNSDEYLSTDGLPGAGGGANVGAGGAGGRSFNEDAEGAGGLARAADVEQLRGGGGGGGGLVSLGQTGTSIGGAGGGAVQLVAGIRIVVGQADAPASPVTGINAGGCGGKAGITTSDGGSMSPHVAGAGGGAGGTIVLEAPIVVGHPGSGIAANGAGGSSSRLDGDPTASRGHDAEISVTRSSGGPSGLCSGGGGRGAAGDVVDGEQGSNTSACTPANGNMVHAGGGGGGAGYIVVRTLTAPTFGAGFVVSPKTSETYFQTTLSDVR